MLLAVLLALQKPKTLGEAVDKLVCTLSTMYDTSLAGNRTVSAMA